MTEAATPAAPAVETPATPPATPAAETPPATPPVAAAPATPAADSLLPPADKVQAEQPPAAPEKPPLAVSQNEGEWFWSDGVKGTGKAPDWYMADKYKTVDAQAKAYAELSKKFGAFTGAPEGGKYEIKLPETVQGEFETDHPLLQGFTAWAAENQLSQKAYNDVLGMFAEYEASLAPDPAEIKKALGENADQRIGSVAAWAKANMTAVEYDEFRAATAGDNAAAVFKTMERLIEKARPPRLPPPGDDVPGAGHSAEAEINALQAKRGPDGKRLYETDPQFRAMVEAKRTALYQSRQKAA